MFTCAYVHADLHRSTWLYLTLKSMHLIQFLCLLLVGKSIVPWQGGRGNFDHVIDNEGGNLLLEDCLCKYFSYHSSKYWCNASITPAFERLCATCCDIFIWTCAGVVMSICGYQRLTVFPNISPYALIHNISYLLLFILCLMKFASLAHKILLLTDYRRVYSVGRLLGTSQQ